QDTTKGKAVYVKWCAGCHGDGGAGDGPAAAYMLPRPRNFTGGLYKIRTTASGQLPTDADLARAIDDGLPGSAMPGWRGRLSNAARRNGVAYIKACSSFFADTSQHVVPPAPPEVRDVVHAPQIPGTVPVSPDDSAWARVTRYWFPLVGQVIHQSRWFAPAVSGVWVQAVHDGKTLALRVSWDDRTESPDTAWLKFEQRILETVAGDDSAPPLKAEPWPDELAIQFPRRLPGGSGEMERPYFLMGAATDPVYQWRWMSRPRRALAGLAR